jgi:uncharacterized membrane protein YbhN (UPF0104 family)
MISIKRLLSIALGGAFFSFCIYYMVCYFQWRAIFHIMMQVDLKLFLGAGVGTTLLFWLMRTIRWFVLLKAIDIQIDFYHLYLVGAVSMAFTIVTPLNSGELLKVELLKKVGALDRVPGYGIFMTERILDLIVVLLMALLSLLFGISKFLDKETMLAVVTVLLLCFTGFFVMIQRVSPTNSVGRFFQSFNQCIRNGKVLASVVLLTIGGWFLVVLGWYVSLRSVGISLTILETAALTAITTLISLFSLIPGALGVGEVSVSSFLVYLKIDVPIAQAGALVIRLYGIMALILGFAHFLAWKLLRVGKRMPADID